ncbi:hypothetical protein [Mycobacteroides abscessus]|uniref:hypothetical protein n=1 Tax=Mycobacteroides abscessus TaxID=36809 RepID=UPI0019D15C36|nr:hypothetical protein [Mycobacteroides abscessus]MBN7374081.1 hypothetical protein [Mycobacteroides abscessus subsp. abscessus]
MPLLTLVSGSGDTAVAGQPATDQAAPHAQSSADPWNLPVQSERFWVYEAKIRSCEITPYFRDRGRCGTCGDAIAVAPGVLAAWVIVAAVAVVGVGVAAIVGEKLVARQIDSAKLHVHVDLYRDIIEAHMRSEAGRLPLMNRRRAAGHETNADD